MMAGKTNGSVPTHADYLAVTKERDALKHEVTGLKGQVTKLTNQLAKATAQVAAAVSRGDSLAAQLKTEKANAAAKAETDMRDAAVPKVLPADQPRWAARSGPKIEKRLFANKAELDAARKAEPDTWFDTRVEAEDAWNEKQSRPLPGLDGQTEAEATT